MPAGQESYTQVLADYFVKRGLRRYAGIASLWALGVGAVISGHYSARSIFRQGRLMSCRTRRIPMRLRASRPASSSSIRWH